MNRMIASHMLVRIIFTPLYDLEVLAKYGVKVSRTFSLLPGAQKMNIYARMLRT